MNLGKFPEEGDALRTYVAAHAKSDEGLYVLAYARFREKTQVGTPCK